MKLCVVIALVLCGVLAANAVVYRYDLDPISKACRLSILNEHDNVVCGRWCKQAEAQDAYDKSTCTNSHCTCTFEDKIPLTYSDLCDVMKIDDPQGNYKCRESSEPLHQDNDAVGSCFGGHHYSRNGDVCVAYSRKYKDLEMVANNWKDDFVSITFVSIPNVLDASPNDLDKYTTLIHESIKRASDPHSRFHSVAYEPFIREGLPIPIANIVRPTHMSDPKIPLLDPEKLTEFQKKLASFAFTCIIGCVAYTLSQIVYGIVKFFRSKKIRITFEDTRICTSISFDDFITGKLTTAFLYETYPNYVFKYNGSVVMRDIDLKHYYGKKLKAKRIVQSEVPVQSTVTTHGKND